MSDDAKSELWRTALERIRERFVGLANIDAAEHFRHDVVFIRSSSMIDSKCRDSLIRYFSDDGELLLLGFNEHFGEEICTRNQHMFRTGLCSSIISKTSPRIVHSIYSSCCRWPELEENRLHRFMDVADDGAAILHRLPHSIQDLLITNEKPFMANYAAWLDCLFAISWKYRGKTDGPIFSRPITKRCFTPNDGTVEWSTAAWDKARTQNPDWPEQLPSEFFSIIRDVPNQSIALIDWLLTMPGEMQSPQGPSRKAVRRKTIGERMAEIYTDDRTCIDWTSGDWAKRLDCEESSVRKSKTWKAIESERESARQSRVKS